MSNAVTLTHGHYGDLAVHIGLCLTDGVESAARYASDEGIVTDIRLDLTGLTVVDSVVYDRDNDVAPGDDGDAHGADVLVYEDEDPHGHQHTTWRLMSQAAVDAATVVG